MKKTFNSDSLVSICIAQLSGMSNFASRSVCLKRQNNPKTHFYVSILCYQVKIMAIDVNRKLAPKHLFIPDQFLSKFVYKVLFCLITWSLTVTKEQFQLLFCLILKHGIQLKSPTFKINLLNTEYLMEPSLPCWSCFLL